MDGLTQADHDVGNKDVQPISYHLSPSTNLHDLFLVCISHTKTKVRLKEKRGEEGERREGQNTFLSGAGGRALLLAGRQRRGGGSHRTAS